MENGHFSAALSAITAKAKLAGLWLEKRQTLNRIDPNQLTDGELMEIDRQTPAQDIRRVD